MYVNFIRLSKQKVSPILMTIPSDLLDASDLNASQITHTKNKSGHAMALHLIAVSLIFHTRIAFSS
jgi:hypothetical protein